MIYFEEKLPSWTLWLSFGDYHKGCWDFVSLLFGESVEAHFDKGCCCFSGRNINLSPLLMEVQIHVEGFVLMLRSRRRQRGDLCPIRLCDAVAGTLQPHFFLGSWLC